MKNIKCFVLLACISLSACLHTARAENLIQNGDFSNDLNGWDKVAVSGPFSVSALSSSVCAPFHTTKAAAFDVFNNRRSALEQLVAIPSGVTANLSMKVWGQLQPTRAFVSVVDQSNNPLLLEEFVATRLVDSYSYPGPTFICTGNSFATKSYDISQFAGQTVKIRLEATSTGNDGTFAIFDDIELNTSSGGGGGDSGKRQSATRIICNRSGDLLSATCTATVGDAGGPPRTTPTGMVTFSAQAGWPSFSAACQLQQTAFSPGVSSCSVSYTPPPSFPIGVAFPLDALYEGNSKLAASATDHQLLFSTCIGGLNSPCSGGAGLDFGSDSLGILGDLLNLVASCGGAKKSKVANHPTLPAEGGSGSCSFETEMELNLASELDEFDADDWQAMAEEISPQMSKRDPLLAEIKRIGELPNEQLVPAIQSTLELAKKLQQANQKYYDKAINKPRSSPMVLRRRAPTIKILLASAKRTVKGGTSKAFNLKLNKRASRIMAVIRASDNDSLSITLRSKLRGVGKRKAQKLSVTQDLAIYP